MGNNCDTSNKFGLGFQPAEIQLQKNQDHADIYANKLNPSNQFNPQYQHIQPKRKVDFINKVKQNIFSDKNPSDIKSLIEQQYLSCKLSYQQHYIDEANEKAQELLRSLAEINKKKVNIELAEQQKKLLEKIKIQYQDVIHYENQIQKEGWELKSDKNGIKISCRRQLGNTVGCRIYAVTDVPFEVLISVIIEIDFYKDYTPFLEISREEKEVARNCRIGYTLNHLPFFTKRQSFFQGVGYSRLNHKSQQLFLFTRSIHDKKDLQQMLEFPVNINQEYIQLDYKYFVVRYRPIKKNVGLIDIAMNIDVKMDFIPTWLMQKVSKDFGQKFFKNIVRISKNFKDSKWEKNVQNNPHLFLYFQKQVKNYLEKHKVQ